MVLKKRHSINVQEDGPKRRRKEVREEPEEIKKKSKKRNEYPVKVEENRLSDEEYEEDDPEDDAEEVEEEEEDEGVNDDPEGDAALGKENINEIGWPQADIIELFNKIEAGLPRNDIISHSTRTERLNWEEIAFNNYSPSECKRVWTYIHKRIRHFRVLKEVIADARIWVHKPWTDFYKGTKTANHPDMPRRPPTKYLLYYAAKKDKVTAQNPNLDMTKISKIVSQMWNALPASKKNKYEQMAAELKTEYNEKLQTFYDQHPGFEEEAKLLKLGSSNKKLARTLSTSAGLPNKPRTAKQLFIEDKLEKMKNEPNLDKREARAEASTQWDSLSDKRRLMWIDRAVEEENKYLEKLKLHKSDNPDFEMPKHKSVLTKDEVLLRNRASGKPSKPPNSAYSLYSKIMLAKCADLRSLVPKERMKEISLRWNKMSESEKEEYQKKVKYEQERFKLDYATYLESLPEEERQEELLKTQKTPRKKASKVHPEVNNGKPAKSKSTKTNKKTSSKKADRQYFPGEPHQPPVNAYDLFVDSFVSDTKLSATEAPRFWEMLPNSDKAKFTRKLTELKEKYIRDYKKFLKSLDEEQVAKYNDLQKRNKEREAAADAHKEQLSDADEDSDEDSSSDEAANENKTVNNKEAKDSDSDENNEAENKKSDSSSDSSSSSESSSDSSSSDDSDSSSDDSDDEDKTSTQVPVKKEESDSDSDSD